MEFYNLNKLIILWNNHLQIKYNKIIVTPADKNVGIVLIESNVYLNLCKKHLLDPLVYSKLFYR